MAFFRVPRFAREIDAMTVRDLEGVCFTQFEDPKNVTIERLLKLSDLARQRDQIEHGDLVQAVDAAELRKRLVELHESTWGPKKGPDMTSPPSTPVTPGPEECLIINRGQAIENFHMLIGEGGRPSRQLQLDPGPCDPENSDEELHPLGHFTMEAAFFYLALERWRAFRKWQKTWRKTPELFTKLQARIRKWRQERGYVDETILLPDAERQTKLNEWKEYHGYQQSVVSFWDRKSNAAQRAFDLEERKAKTDSPCWKEFWAWESQLALAKRKHQEARPVLDWIEQELPIVMTENQVEEQESDEPSSAKNMLVPRIHTLQDTKLAFDPAGKVSVHLGGLWPDASVTAMEMRKENKKSYHNISKSTPASFAHSRATNDLKRKRTPQPDISTSDNSEYRVEQNLERRKRLMKESVEDISKEEILSPEGLLPTTNTMKTPAPMSAQDHQNRKRKRTWDLDIEHPVMAESQTVGNEPVLKKRRHSIAESILGQRMCSTEHLPTFTRNRKSFSAGNSANKVQSNDKHRIRRLSRSDKENMSFVTSKLDIKHMLKLKGERGEELLTKQIVSVTDAPEAPRPDQSQSRPEGPFPENNKSQGKLQLHDMGSHPPQNAQGGFPPKNPILGAKSKVQRVRSSPLGDNQLPSEPMSKSCKGTLKSVKKLLESPFPEHIEREHDQAGDTAPGIERVMTTKQALGAAENVAMDSLKRKAASDPQDPSSSDKNSGTVSKRRKILPKSSSIASDEWSKLLRSRSRAQGRTPPQKIGSGEAPKS